MCLFTGAVTLYSIELLLERLLATAKSVSVRRVAYIAPAVVVVFFSVLALSRVVAVCRFVTLLAYETMLHNNCSNYHAPFDVYSALGEHLIERSRGHQALPDEVNICVGKEWYRYGSMGGRK